MSTHTHTHSDLAQLFLDLVGHEVGPVLLPQKVPEHSTNQRIDPLGLARLWEIREIAGALWENIKQLSQS